MVAKSSVNVNLNDLAWYAPSHLVCTVPTVPNKYIVGDTVNYIWEARNSSTVRTATVDVVNTFPDGSSVTLDTGLVLAPGEAKTYKASYVIKLSDVNMSTKKITDTLTVNGYDDTPIYPDDIQALMVRTSNVAFPQLTIDVSAPTSAAAGSEITYTYLITNNGDATLNNPIIVDFLLGTITGPATLAPGQSATVTMNRLITGTDPDPIPNQVTATYDVAGITVPHTVTATDNHSIDIHYSPIALDDATTTDEDTPVIIPTLGNDSDPNGDPLKVKSTTQGANGSVVINQDNTVTYTPNPNFNGTDTFNYTITNGYLTASATVTVTIDPCHPCSVK